MHPHPHRHSIFCILPPHMLEEIARSGDPEHRDWALQTLAVDATMRSERVTEQLLRVPTAALATPHKERSIYTANHGTALPGTLVRSEAQAATGDAATDEAYDGFGATFDLYWSIFQRNSIDNAGLNLIGTVHYGQNYDNAFWNGSQMVFGDGDGTYFNRFTASIDVIGHELTHGVTGHQANLVYHDQPGALNESISDVFGSLVKQYAHAPQQTAAQADWLIGAGLFTKRRQRGRAAIDEGTGDGVRRQGAREGSAARAHEPVRRHDLRQRWRAHQLGHPEPRVLPPGRRTRRPRVGEGRPDLVHDPLRPAPVVERAIPGLRQPHGRQRRSPVR